MGGNPANEAASRYAAALRAFVQPLLQAGYTQRRLSTETSFSAAAVSRYLSGERVAPKTFIGKLVAFAAHVEVDLPTDLEKLRELRERAEKEGSPAAQLRHLQEENEWLKNKTNKLDDPDALLSSNSGEPLPDNPQTPQYFLRGSDFDPVPTLPSDSIEDIQWIFCSKCSNVFDAADGDAVLVQSIFAAEGDYRLWLGCPRCGDFVLP
ncbi:helix-turn-helix domain-containing protein [Streptomyces sp. R08]|uniref:Helix-turn-helix domain-containing protein n=1 Tax=Streptomyces sp. R08 TaxID=3238624 RepID=A0AB39MRJ0_9ACTN